MYVNRGLFEAARSEAELASVLAHEMAHVALRHGTHQASKAYLGQAGLGILGGLLGKNGGNTAQIVNAVGGLGLNAVFLKFSRDAEYQADQVGAAIMAGAGYNPVAMADFFGLLRSEQGRDPGKVERFFSDHPAAGDREARIRDQAGSLQLARSQRRGRLRRHEGRPAETLSRFPAGCAAVGGATEPGQPQPGQRSVRRAGGPAVLAVPEVRAAQRLLHHRAPRQLAGLRVRLRIRRVHGARRGRRRHGQRPAGHALRGDRQPLRALRGGNGSASRRAGSAATRLSRTRTGGAGAWRTPPTTSSVRSSDRTRTCRPRTARHDESRSTGRRPSRWRSPAARPSPGRRRE